MVVGVGASLTGLPTQTITTQTGTQAQTGLQSGNSAGTDQSRYQFTNGQLAMQDQLGQYAGQLLSGQGISPWMGLPQSVWDAAHANFNNFQAPKIAAVNGAGSPAIASAAQQMDLQLAGMGGQHAFGNALDAFSQAAQFAFKPVGNNAMNTATRSANSTDLTNTNQNTNTLGIDYGGLLSALGGVLGGGFSPVNVFGGQP